MPGVYWENALPPDIVDRLGAAFPRFIAAEYYRRRVQEIAKRDACIIYFTIPIALVALTNDSGSSQGNTSRFA